MKPSCIEMLRHHAYRSPNPEVRKTCQEMLDAINDPQPVHLSQSILTTPEQREAYLAGIARNLDAAPEPEQADFGSANTAIYLIGAATLVLGAVALWAVL